MFRSSLPLVVLGMVAQALAPLPAPALDADVVPVPILSARVTRVGEAVFPPSDCLAELDVTVTPDAPLSVDIGCTFATISIEGNTIVATREPPGSADFNVQVPEIVVDVPESRESYLPLVVTHTPGFASRLRPVSEDGEFYASAFAHPTCNCTYTFPALSAERLTFEGGRFTSTTDRYEFLVVSAKVQRPSDGDGVPDTNDSCPDTNPDTTIDSSGCSQSQFCKPFVIESLFDALACIKADWMGDEPPPWPGDCRVSFDSGSCVSR
jgi:hypothetical protein